MFHRFFNHIKEGFVGVKRHFSVCISSASAVMITLTILGFFAILMVNVTYTTTEVEKSISLVALVDYEVSSETSIHAMSKQIKELSGVDHVDYRTKDEEFDYYVEMYSDMAEFSELYRDENPFHDAFIIYASDGSYLESIKASVLKINGIESVEDGGSNTYKLVTILESLRTAGLVLIGALLFLAVYLIYNTIKIAIATRKDEIWIMRNVGAKNSYIRAPFLVEGIIIGVMGSVIPIGLVIYAYNYLYQISGGVVLGVINLYPCNPFLLYLCLLLVGVGIVVGFIGSYLGVCKFLRLKR